MRFALLTLLAGCQVVFPLEVDASEVCGGHSTAARTQLCTVPNDQQIQLLGMVNTGDPAIPDDCETVDPQNGTEVCIITGATIDVGNAVVIGSRPLVLVARRDLRVSGTLSVASTLVQRGAGADFKTCASDLGGGTIFGGNGAGGGAGGGFRSDGGVGGIGQNAAGGVPSRDSTAVSFIRGGCPGGSGGDSTTTPAPGGIGGTGGSSGGAIYLIAGGTISIEGVLDASGSGGEGGQPGAGSGTGGGGGGGGGSGGMIGLDAPAIILEASAKLVANGGGGGGGGPPSGAHGADGGSPDVSMFPFRAAGGISLSAGNGGTGATVNDLAIDGASDSSPGAAGGGGGGGLGLIVLAGVVDDRNAGISPDPEP